MVGRGSSRGRGRVGVGVEGAADNGRRSVRTR